MRTCYAAQRFWTLHEGSGWEGIRTPGALRHTRFPGVHNRPLCHPSRLRRRVHRPHDRTASSHLQASEQFVERELNPDEELPEFGEVRTDRIKAHCVNNFLDVK